MMTEAELRSMTRNLLVAVDPRGDLRGKLGARTKLVNEFVATIWDEIIKLRGYEAFLAKALEDCETRNELGGEA